MSSPGLVKAFVHLRHLCTPYRAAPWYSRETAEYPLKQMKWLHSLEEIMFIIAVKISLETVLFETNVVVT